MKPGHEERRKIIREWMAFPKDKRLVVEAIGRSGAVAVAGAAELGGRWQQHPA